MIASKRMIRGLKEAIKLTGISARQASLKAGYNEHQVNRFITGKTDIKLRTLENVCAAFEYTFEDVWVLGGGNAKGACKDCIRNEATITRQQAALDEIIRLPVCAMLELPSTMDMSSGEVSNWLNADDVHEIIRNQAKN